MNDLRPALLAKELKLLKEKKTSKEWQREIPYPKVLDPDGWDRSNFQYSWREELITKEEYFNRVSYSTCIHKIKEDKENDESTSTTKSTDKEDSKIPSKSRHPHFPPRETDWM
jgi:hypothetical protein